MSFIDDLEPAPEAQKGSLTVTATGGQFDNVVMPDDLAGDFSRIFRMFGYDPAHFEIVDDTVKCSTWQQSARGKDGSRDLIQLYSYSARFRKTPAGRLAEFDVSEHIASIRKFKPIRRLPVLDGDAPECAAVINLADIQGGKSEGGGVEATRQRLGDGLGNVVYWLADMARIGRNITEIVLVNNGDPYEGCAGNYAAQLFTVELNLRAQMRFVLEVWKLYAKTLLPLVPKAQFVSVLSNHSELNRLGSSKNQTSDSDSGDGLLAEILRMILAENPAFDHVEWTIPHDEMVVYPVISGIQTAFTHGHKIPGNDATNFEKWLNGQARGDERAHSARVWVTAHRHNLQLWDLGSTTVIQCPSLDGGSKWLRDMTGKYSRSGIVALLVGQHHRLGWSDLAFL